MALFRIPRFITKTYGCRDLESKAYPVAAVFLVILLLFNTGFIFALAHQPVVMSPSLFHEELPMFVHAQDLAGARWLTSASGIDEVWVDYLSREVLLAYSNPPIEKIHRLYEGKDLGTNNVIYVNLNQATSTYFYTNPQTAFLLGIPPIISPEFTSNMSKIYDSGCAIYST